jgi:hypothetical protein
VILNGNDTIHQTIYDDDDTHLEAIAFDEASGKIATCCNSEIRVYKPYGLDEGALKACETVNNQEPLTDNNSGRSNFQSV